MTTRVIMNTSRPNGSGGTYKAGVEYDLADDLAELWRGQGICRRTSVRSEQTGAVVAATAGNFPDAPAQNKRIPLEVVMDSAQGVGIQGGALRLGLANSAWQIIAAHQTAGVPTIITAFSDSTGGNSGTGGDFAGTTTRFLRRLCDTIAARFPAARVRARYWDDTGKAWPALTTVSAGTGGADVIVNIGFVSGSRLEYIAGDRWPALTAMPWDVAIINHGFNYTLSTWPTTESLVAAMSATVEQILATCPDALTIIVAQAPGSASANAPMAAAAKQLAAELGCPVADAYSRFVAAGNVAGLYLDTQHQTDSGDALILPALLDAMDVPALPAESGLVRKVMPETLNATFLLGSANAVPTGYTGSNVTVTDVTTAGLFESGTRALKLARTANGSPSNMYYNVTGAELAAILGKTVTFCVKQNIPATAPTGSGRIGIEPRNAGGIITASKVTSAAAADGRGRLRWYSQATTIPADATSVRLYLYADASNAVDASETTVDRAFLVLGDRVRDFLIEA